MNLPNYRFDLTREIKGSVDYIAERLVPKGRPVEVMLWTGDCIVPPEAIIEANRHGLLNMNGGDTVITESASSWTRISSNGLRDKNVYQVYAPIQNENVYTNDWTGPFYGYERVIETFRLTGEPFRLKPVGIYYHTYSASKPASIAALHKVYRWAAAETLTPVYASQYIRKVNDFEATTIARDRATGDLLVRTGADLRTLRLPPGEHGPSLAASTGIAGLAPGPSGAYLTMSAPQARLKKNDGHRVPHIADASGAISELTRKEDGGVHELRFALTSAGSTASFTLRNAEACTVSVDGRIVKPAPGPGISKQSRSVRKADFTADSEPDSATQIYELGLTLLREQATRHLAFIRCSV